MSSTAQAPMLPNPGLAQAIANLLREICATHHILPEPQLEWSRRMRRMLGVAFPKQRVIRLSAWLDRAQAEETLRHELAHIAADSRRRAPSHGPQWREWAIRLGARPRAAALGPPALVPPRISPALAWGLECQACGQRFVRRRVLRGVYHQSCGPREGRLRRVLRASHDEVMAWAQPSSNP